MATGIAIVSIVIALVAFFVNLSGLIRRPRIVAEWGFVKEEPPYEGLSVLVTARRRSIEVDEIGVVLLGDGTRRRQFPEWLNVDTPFRVRLPIQDSTPKLLQDGQTVRGFGELERVGEQIGKRKGRAYAYVIASGTVYLAWPNSKLQKRLRRRVGS